MQVHVFFCKSEYGYWRICVPLRIGLLDKWKERNGPRATYRQLVECLYEAKAIHSVDVLCRELGAPQNVAHTLPGPPQRSPPHQGI